MLLDRGYAVPTVQFPVAPTSTTGSVASAAHNSCIIQIRAHLRAANPAGYISVQKNDIGALLAMTIYSKGPAANGIRIRSHHKAVLNLHLSIAPRLLFIAPRPGRLLRKTWRIRRKAASCHWFRSSLRSITPPVGCRKPSPPFARRRSPIGSRSLSMTARRTTREIS